MIYALWTLIIGLMVTGLIGSVVPLLPGTTLILGATLLHSLSLGEPITGGVVAWVAGLWVLSVLADFLGTLLGARLFGGSKWGMAGATGGALVGMFFRLPGLLLSTFLGGILAEKFLAKKDSTTALRAGFGGALGLVLSTGARLVCALAMLAVYSWALWRAWA